MPSERRKAKIKRVLEQRQPDLTVVLENIHDPHNVSAILRTCDAVGIESVMLLYNIEPFPKIGKKSSASAGKWIEREKYSSVNECFAALRSRGFKIYTTHMGERSLSVYELDLAQKTALVFGNEHRGVSDEAVKLADGNFLIPQCGMLQSLNVSVACAVTLYEAFRQKLVAGHYTSSRFSPQELAEKITRWEIKAS